MVPALVVLLIGTADVTASADPVILPGPAVHAGHRARIEIVAPTAARSCRLAVFAQHRWGRSYRVSLGGPTRFVHFRANRRARGSYTTRLNCYGPGGASLGTVRTSIVVGRKGTARVPLIRHGSVRVSAGSIPELRAPRAHAAQDDPSSNNEVSTELGEGDPAKFTECRDSTWVRSTRTIGDGIATYIQFVPSPGARGRGGNENSSVYGEMWSDLNRCAHFSADISDAQRHSMYVQMACHSKWGVSSWVGGNTWDLEAWRNDVEWSDGMSYGGRCGQRYGDVPGAGSHLQGRLISTFPDPNPSQRAAYFVDNLDGIYLRRHITTTKAYGCMRAQGREAARWYPLHFVETYLPMGPEIGDDICPAPDAPATAGPAPQPAAGPAPAGATTPLPKTREVTVYNQVTNGGSAMREDTPGYLSTVTRNFCKRDGCALPGTDMGTGARVTAYCQAQGDRTTNGWDANAGDDGNPNLYESRRWYGIRWGDGRTGFLSEVWIQASDRGGVGLPGC